MASFWRRAGSTDPMRVAAAGLGVSVLALVAAYVVAAASSSQASAAGVVSAAAFVAIAGAGLLYAWRLGAGGLAD